MRVFERLCLWLGAAGLLLVGGAYMHGALAYESALRAFDARTMDESQPAADPTADPSVDQGVLAVLEIARLDMRVPVFLGTDEVTLNKGSGIIAGTAIPGEVGNIAIAGHRDSHFRPLEKLRAGDLLELQTARGDKKFRVTDIWITDPLDISVLDDTDGTTLTLITCFPFRYVGSAPDRYVVRAVPVAGV